MKTVELHKNHRMTHDVEEKLCSHCKKWIPLIDEEGKPTFNTRNASKDGLSYSCKKCEVDTAKASYKRVKNKKKQRQRYEENREKVLDRSREYYEKNKDAILDRCKTYRQNNPEVFRDAGAKRRAILKEVEKVAYTRKEIIDRDSEWLRVDDKDVFIPICQICGNPVLIRSELQIDHIIPLAEGGADAPHNVRVACKTCNIRRPKDGRDTKKEG